MFLGTSIPPIEPKLVLANNTVNNDQRPAADHDNDSYSDSASLDDEEEQDGSFITKQDFQEFIKEYRKDKAVTMGLLHQLVNLVEPLLCNSQSLLSPSFRCQEDSIPINTVSEIQDKVYCTVISDGETHELRLHPATIARLEAQKSKRGICNEVLMHLHPDVGYYNNLTVSGKSNRKSKDASDLRPLPLITKLFCIEVVNKLKPLDRSKFSSNDIYTEELKKYNVETVGQIGKSILDIRGKAGTGRRKNIQDATVLGEASSSPE
ncbi:unnamed protein product [Orchesella dallaii]|uniref:BEN domain-containing protein n=1 Tax=Orchesella dallaii TaxID=48710 RepID=A0ABP1Q4V0_9HEXA